MIIFAHVNRCIKIIPPVQFLGSSSVYTGPEDQILCYRHSCIGGELTEESKKRASKLPKSAVPISLYGGMTSFIIDLDSDGIYEYMYDLVVRDINEEELLITLIKTKLGIISKGQ